MRGLIVMREHLELIRSGVKTQTRRLHKRPLRAGDKVFLKRNLYKAWEPKIIIVIMDVYEQRLGDMTEQDALCEGFRSLLEFKAMWSRYSGVAWCSNLVVQVYEFKLFHNKKYFFK